MNRALLNMTAVEQAEAFLAGGPDIPAEDTVRRLLAEVRLAEDHRGAPAGPFCYIPAKSLGALNAQGFATVYAKSTDRRTPNRPKGDPNLALYSTPLNPPADMRKLLAFAGHLLEHLPELHDIDGGDLQKWATEHGLLELRDAPVPCCNACRCLEHGEEPGDITRCYRPTPLFHAAYDAYRAFCNERARRKK